jgi:cystinosin
MSNKNSAPTNRSIRFFLLKKMIRSSSLETFSIVIGWIYFIAWSVSFYPQILLNYRRKSVDGMSFEYFAYNLTGYLCYLTFLSQTFILQHKFNVEKSVEINDIAYAAHALVLTLITLGQTFIYERRGQTFSKLHAGIIAVLWILVGIGICVALAGNLPWYALNLPGQYRFNFLESLGYVKTAVSFIKCVPQVYLNYKRQSTVGWPIQNVLLDLTGGVCSFLQEFVDAYNKDDFGIFTTNLPKLFLAIETIIFDFVFIFQHFVLYRGKEPVHYARISYHDSIKEEETTAINTPQKKSI